MKQKVVVEPVDDRRELTARRPTAARRGRRARRPAPSRCRRGATPSPVGSSTNGVLASDSVRWRRSSLHVLHAGDDGDAAHQAEAEREGPAALVEHRVAQRGGAGADGGDDAAGGQHGVEGGEHRRVLQRAAQVHRRVADQVHGPGAADRRRPRPRPRRRGAAAPSAPRPRRPGARPTTSTSRDQRRRLLERVGGRQHDDAVGAGCGEQAAVEVVVGDERAAAVEGDHAGHARSPGHGGRLYAPLRRRHRFGRCRVGVVTHG